jgi:hypothetical protein
VDMIVELLGYAPDADPHVLGVLTNCSGVIPTLRGLKGAPSPASAGMATLAATCQGGALLSKLDGTTRLISGTALKLYEAGASTWTDVSRAATYTAGTTSRWRFAQHENVSLAANGADTLQASVSTGAFSCVAGAPIAEIVETAGKFVFALKTSTNAHGVQWSALGNYASWSASVATQAGSDTLTATPGPITAGKRFGNALVVYKKSSMYIGTYAGPPNVWEFTLIPGSAGALSNEVVVNIGTAENPKHIFMGEDDFYVYDGSRPIRIGTNRISQQVFGTLFHSRFYACAALHDKKNSLVYFYYPSTDSALPDKGVVYNYRTDKWGVADQTIEAALEFVAAAVTYDSVGALYATYDDFPAFSYDSAFLGATKSVPAVFTSSHVLKTMTGPSVSSSLTTGDYGNDMRFNTLTRVRPRFLTAPDTARMTNYYRNNTGDDLSEDAITDLSSRGCFDVIRDARWHRLEFNFTGDWEMPSIVPEWSEAGFE